MLKKNIKTLLPKVIWLFGLILLSFIINEIKITISEEAKATFDLTYLYWINFPFAFLIGCYTSFLFIESWKFKLNLPLLILVSIPLTFISIIPLLVVLFSNKGILPESLYTSIVFINLNILSSMDVFSIIAGLTFIISLFSGKRKQQA